MGKEQQKQEIREYCKLLGLRHMAGNFEAALSGPGDSLDYLHALLSGEIEEKSQRSIDSRIRSARFPYRKYLSGLDEECLPDGLRSRLPELKTLEFIPRGQNVILTGNPGTGKTHTAIGLGLAACESGYRVLFTTVPHLVTELMESKDRKKLRSYERSFEKYDLVIADELGYVSFDRAGADLLFANLSLRSMEKSTIITSNLTFSRWDEVFGDAALTSAIVDRLTYRAILINMEGDSYRLRETMRENGGDFDLVRERGTAASAGPARIPGGTVGHG